MSRTSGPLVRAYHHWHESHETAHPTATKVFLQIAGSATVRATVRLQREARDA